MPSIFSKKSNRSHQSVDVSSGQSSPNPSVNIEGAQRYPPTEGQHAVAQSQQSPHPGAQGVSQGQYRPQQPQHYPPARTQSTHRLSAHLDQTQSYQQQQQQQQQPPQQQPGPPQLSPNLDQNHRASYQQQPQPQSPPSNVHEPKKSLRSRIVGGLTGHKDDDASKHQKNGVNRRTSVRKSDSKLAEQQLHGLQPAQQWHQGSSPHLPPSNEQDEDNLDPFLQHSNHSQPQVPPKDYPLHPQQQQQQQQQSQFVANPQQQQYNRPPLDRVSTEGSYHTQGGVSQYSPDHHQPQSLQPQQQQQTGQQQQQQYQSYHPPAQNSQNTNEYQAFNPNPHNPNPQTVPSPLLGNAQLHTQGPNTSHQPQPVYYQPPQDQSPQQVQAHSPQDQSQQNIHYQQQFAPPPQPQPHHSQDFQQQLQANRASSQQPPELQHPQAVRQLPPQIVQAQQLDTQQLQQLRPPSSQLAPPSPLQPQPYKTYDSQPGQQPQSSQQHQPPPQASDSHSTNTTPPQPGQDNMPPSGQNSGRNTLRKVNDVSQQPGAPSRESSLLQQPAGQGQPLGQPPVSPGLPTFDANVVPTASQGQPYRGEKGQQPPQAQSGEVGRATPPPRPSASEMSDEEIEKMMKEHEVLREKYQKVKRYFFEQQSQVHQLQNTLANQRLSLSRTSWDDSEYATRFNRLDGLIAQLSFSIRKDWKAIPQFLHTVVNKTAVETGKQEMTAVGRAFISYWLVENIFEKYFHPDLEPGFSTQLQSIVLNIRKFAPTCHSPEDEDSLAAKIINWRLATLEGLADTLRSPQAAEHRQKLTDTLNEKLIASLQMHMNDPAPPDLNGGVPMIVELAISIAQHLPLESREVHIEYFPPGHGIVPDFMKLESGIPALTAPILELDEADRASLRSVASKDVDNASIAEQEQQAAMQQNPQGLKEEKKRGGVFGGLMGGGSKKPTTAPASLGKRESSLGAGGSQQSLTQNPPGSSNGPKEDAVAARVRMAVGVAVQIRGKSILMKAPVYST